jgi:DNA-binding HxlR family transcriptional regulator
VLTVFHALLMMRLLPRGFRSRELRDHPLTGDVRNMDQGRLSYQLRRLRLLGLIDRVKGAHRYEVSERGMRIALYFTRR